jgi:RNA polymerase sigma-70 factor (ECF subfamily)
VSSDDGKAAVADAYRAYYRRLVAVVYAATGDYGGAQDVVQEAYARALDRPRQFLAVADQQAWLRVVALNFARQRWRRQQILDRLVRLGRVARPVDVVPGLSGERVDLVRALQRLSRPTREAIVLHHLLDLPVTAVADELGVPVGTVKARLARGRVLLGGYLDRVSHPPMAHPSGSGVPDPPGRASLRAATADAAAASTPAVAANNTANNTADA